eukprot:COSAG06_NODE_20756_length_782_cov_2.070278_1_plen_107_part_10
MRNVHARVADDPQVIPNDKHKILLERYETNKDIELATPVSLALTSFWYQQVHLWWFSRPAVHNVGRGRPRGRAWGPSERSARTTIMAARGVARWQLPVDPPPTMATA